MSHSNTEGGSKQSERRDKCCSLNNMALPGSVSAPQGGISTAVYANFCRLRCFAYDHTQISS